MAFAELASNISKNITLYMCMYKVFLTGKVTLTGGRKSCSEYIFLKNNTAGLSLSGKDMQPLSLRSNHCLRLYWDLIGTLLGSLLNDCKF